jgi:tetratricopeptide (TPR) repeat protein
VVQYDEALAECQKIIATDPNFFAGLRYAGLVYEQMKRYDEAIAALEKAREAVSISSDTGGAGSRARVAGNVTKHAA